MGTPNSSEMSFRVIDLIRSEDREEFATALKAQEVVQAIVRTLRPILRYIAEPFPFEEGLGEGCVTPHHFYMGPPPAAERAVEVLQLGPVWRLVRNNSSRYLEYLLLGEDGTFFTADLCKNHQPRHFHRKVLPNPTEGIYSWERAPFQELIEALQRVLDVAVRRRETHLESIQARKAKLDEMLAILQRESDS